MTNETTVHPVQKSNKNFRVERPTQTGFSSPATHYNEPRIDLNSALVSNASSTFFIRVSDDAFQEFEIMEDDILIIDKALVPHNNQLVLAIEEDTFQVTRIGERNRSQIILWGVITHIIKSVL